MSSFFATSRILFAASATITLLGVQFAAAQAMGPPQDLAVAAVRPGYEVLALARSAGFEPLGRPFLRGRIYWLHAISPRGQDVALTIDAASGRILSVTPASGPPPVRYGGTPYDPPGPYGRAYEDQPPYGRGPYAYGPPAYGAPRGYDPPAYGSPGPQAYGSAAYGPRGSYVGEDEEMPTGATAPSLPPHSIVTTPPRTPLPRPRPQEAIASSNDPGTPAAPQSVPTRAAAPTPNDQKAAGQETPAAQPSTALPPVTPLD